MSSSHETSVPKPLYVGAGERLGVWPGHLPKTRAEPEEEECSYRSSEEQVLRTKGRLSAEGALWCAKNLPEKYGDFPARELRYYGGDDGGLRKDLPGEGYRRGVERDSEAEQSAVQWAADVASQVERQIRYSDTCVTAYACLCLATSTCRRMCCNVC